MKQVAAYAIALSSLAFLAEPLQARVINGPAAYRIVGADVVELCWKSPRECVKFAPVVRGSYANRAQLCPKFKAAAEKKKYSFDGLKAELTKDKTNVVRADFATCLEGTFYQGLLCIDFAEGGQRGKVCAYVTEAK